MNRRGFFKTLAAATAGFSILPPATTYQRVWKATPMVKWYPIPDPIPFDPINYRGTWRWLDDDGKPMVIPRLPFPKGVHSNKEITWTNLCLNP